MCKCVCVCVRVCLCVCIGTRVSPLCRVTDQGDFQVEVVGGETLVDDYCGQGSLSAVAAVERERASERTSLPMHVDHTERVTLRLWV